LADARAPHPQDLDFFIGDEAVANSKTYQRE
jgi:hypothetical protein